ncbi:hypothetical protein O988_03796 [Pseudogymnoascus sp. VKM F-3808]|nr:hypothetical protein O988_03796 [Pseudogymnoascus sp. VKM F-3808]
MQQNEGKDTIDFKSGKSGKSGSLDCGTHVGVWPWWRSAARTAGTAEDWWGRQNVVLIQTLDKSKTDDGLGDIREGQHDAFEDSRRSERRSTVTGTDYKENTSGLIGLAPAKKISTSLEVVDKLIDCRIPSTS